MFSKIPVSIIRATREHPDLRRGSSIRGAIDMAHLLEANGGKPSATFWEEVTIMALHSKVEKIDGSDKSVRDILIEILDNVLENFY